MLCERLNRPRGSPPPTKEEFESYCRNVDKRGFVTATREVSDRDKKQERESERQGEAQDDKAQDDKRQDHEGEDNEGQDNEGQDNEEQDSE
jgi:hypothetical protein